MNTECNRTEAATFSSRVASIREIERRRVPFKTNPGHTPICNAKKYQFFKTLNANRISKNFLSRTVTLYNDIANSIDSSFFSDTPILFFFLYNRVYAPLETWMRIHVTLVSRTKRMSGAFHPESRMRKPAIIFARPPFQRAPTSLEHVTTRFRVIFLGARFPSKTG